MEFAGRLLLFIILSSTSFSFASVCVDFENPKSIILNPVAVITPEELYQKALRSKKSLGFLNYAWPNVKTLCSEVPSEAQTTCLNTSATILSEAMDCLSENETVKQLRPLTWAFLRNPKLAQMITSALKKKASSQEEVQLQKEFWDKYRVLLLPGNIRTEMGMTLVWGIEDLKQTQLGFEKLKKAIATRTGSKNTFYFSHLWGAGGTLLRMDAITHEEMKPVSNQFGEIYNTYPTRIHVVVNVTDTKTKMGPNQIAQRIAHENGHSNDYLLGYYLSGDSISWSETSFSKIFEMCDVKPSYEVPLFACLKNHPTWFNFHPTKYSASRSAEFYTKMLDQWVRENLKINLGPPYRCQNNSTENLWKEMELNLIGEVLSPVCNTR